MGGAMLRREPWTRPSPTMRGLGCLVLVGASAHIAQMRTDSPGLVDLVWICNTMLVVACVNLLARFHRGVNWAVFFWTALGSVTWAAFLVARPDQFRVTSLTSHALLPAASGWLVFRQGVPRGGWRWALGIGQLSFVLFMAFHPQKDLLFLFNYSDASALVQIVAVVAVQLYYGLCVAGSWWVARRWGLVREPESHGGPG